MALQFDDLIKDVLGELTESARRTLQRRLQDIGEEFAVTQVAASVSRFVLKSLDGVVKESVQALEMQEDAERFSVAYLDEIQDQNAQWMAALEGYLPHALAVETAKKNFGSSSVQANDARKARAEFIEECKEEVRDIFKAVVGKDVTD